MIVSLQKITVSDYVRGVCKNNLKQKVYISGNNHLQLNELVTDEYILKKLDSV